MSHISDIFSQHSDFIWSIIRTKVNNEDQAWELFQNLYVTLATRNLPSNIINIRSYLYRAIINQIVELARKRQRQRQLLQNVFLNLKILIKKEPPRNVSISKVDKILEFMKEELSYNEEKAIILKYLEGYKISEIARKLDVKKSTVSSYLHSGIKKIRLLIKERPGDFYE